VDVDRTKPQACPLQNLASHQQTVFDDKFHRLSGCFWQIQLTSQNLDIGWCIDADRNSVALDFYDLDRDVTVDDQFFTCFAT